MTGRFRNTVLGLAALLVVLCAGVWFLLRTADRIRVGTAVVSHTLCSGAFVSGVDPDLLYAEAVKPIPGQHGLAKRLKSVIDRQAREVTVTWAGVIQSRAIYREGFGCMLVHGDEPKDAGISKVHGRKVATTSMPQAGASLELQPHPGCG